ncbi:unnamed protein product, partial [Polarella glacialis]
QQHACSGCLALQQELEVLATRLPGEVVVEPTATGGGDDDGQGTASAWEEEEVTQLLNCSAASSWPPTDGARLDDSSIRSLTASPVTPRSPREVSRELPQDTSTASVGSAYEAWQTFAEGANEHGEWVLPDGCLLAEGTPARLELELELVLTTQKVKLELQKMEMEAQQAELAGQSQRLDTQQAELGSQREMLEKWLTAGVDNLRQEVLSAVQASSAEAAPDLQAQLQLMLDSARSDAASHAQQEATREQTIGAQGKELESLRLAVKGLSGDVSYQGVQVLKAQGGADAAYAEAARHSEWARSIEKSMGSLRQEIQASTQAVATAAAETALQSREGDLRKQCRVWIDEAMENLQGEASTHAFATVAAETALQSREVDLRKQCRVWIDEAMENLQGEASTQAAATAAAETILQSREGDLRKQCRVWIDEAMENLQGEASTQAAATAAAETALQSREGDLRKQCRVWIDEAMENLQGEAMNSQSVKALELLGEMTSVKLDRSMISWNAAVATCSKAGRWQEALLLGHLMAEKALGADMDSCSTLLMECELRDLAAPELSLIKRLSNSARKGDLPPGLGAVLDISASLRSTRSSDASLDGGHSSPESLLATLLASFAGGVLPGGLDLSGAPTGAGRLGGGRGKSLPYQRELALLRHVLCTAETGNPAAAAQAVDGFGQELGAQGAWAKFAGGSKAQALLAAVCGGPPSEDRTAGVLEIGTYCGNSAMRLAAVLPGIRVTTLELDPVLVAIARSLVAFAGLAAAIDVWTGHSRLLIPRLHSRLAALSGQHPFFSAVFMDRWGSQYDEDLALIEEHGLLQEAGGVLVADNVLSTGAGHFLWRVAGSVADEECKPPFVSQLVEVREVADDSQENWMSVSVCREGGRTASQQGLHRSLMPPELAELQVASERLRERVTAAGGQGGEVARAEIPGFTQRAKATLLQRGIAPGEAGAKISFGSTFRQCTSSSSM